MIRTIVLKSLASGLIAVGFSTAAFGVGPYIWDGGGSTSNLLLNENWTDDIGPADAQVRAGGNTTAVNVDTSIIFAGTTRLDPFIHAPGWSSDDTTPPTVNPDTNSANIYNSITFDSTEQQLQHSDVQCWCHGIVADGQCDQRGFRVQQPVQHGSRLTGSAADRYG
jgi:hypothetical protein